MANTTWNASDKTANITLSGLNLIATQSQAVANGGVRAVNAQALSGKYYWEITANTFTNTSSGVGVATSAATLNSGTNAVNPLCNLNQLGTLRVSNATMASFGTITSGTVICIAFDVGNSLIWFRLGAAGNWNNNAAYSPGGAGGVALFGSATACYPVALLGNQNDQVTANFGDTAFTGAVPTGYTSGFPAPSTPLFAATTQIAAEHWLSAQAQTQLTQVAVEQWASVGGTVPHIGNYTYGISGTRAGLSGAVLDQATGTRVLAMPVVIGESGTPPPALPSGAQARVWVMA